MRAILSLIALMLSLVESYDLTKRQAPSKFISWNGSQFQLNGKQFIPVGPNAPWLGLLKEPSIFPSHAQIEEAFQLAVAMNATVIRSHTLGISSGTPNSLRPLYNALNQPAFEPIDYAFLMARKYAIKIIAPVLDNYDFPNGGYYEFTNELKQPREMFWTDGTARSNFKQYLNDWLNHVNQYTQDCPELMFIELGNELGNLRPERGIYSSPTNEWITAISVFIRTIDKNHMILNPTDEQLGVANDFAITQVDAFSQHYYAKSYSQIDKVAAKARAVKKPFLIGEYDSGFGADWFAQIENRTSVAGTLYWAMYPHVNGAALGAQVVNNDGYPENKAQLQLIANHFQRLQGFPLSTITDYTTPQSSGIGAGFIVLIVLVVLGILGVCALVGKRYWLLRRRAKQSCLAEY